MSSASVETNSTSVGTSLSASPHTGVISSKPTTENKGIPSTSQHVRLRSQRPRQSKVDPTISCYPDTGQQPNGGLSEFQGFESSNPTNRTTSDISSSRDGTDPVELSEESVASIEVCRFFERNGYCRYGRNCRYHHPISGRPKLPKPKSALKPKKLDEKDASTSAEPADEPPKHTETKNAPDKVCRFYSRRGFCLYGKSCRFVHQAPPQVNQSGPEATLNDSSEQNDIELPELEVEQPSDGGNHDTSRGSNRTCKYYSRYGDCRFGDLCKFRHLEPREINRETVVNDEKAAENEDSKLAILTSEQETSRSYVTQVSNESQGSSNFSAPKPVTLKNKKRSDMTTSDMQKLRKTEINQLKRKYPKCVETALPDVGNVFEILFFPTDPDWRFDVKSITMSVMIPETYPEENLQVDLLNPDEMLPEKLVRYFNKTTFSWLQEQQEKNHFNDEVQLIFRPFLKWLDKNLEDIFIGGLKMVKREMEAAAAGIQFVTHEELNANNNNKGKENKPVVEEETVEAEDPPYYEEAAPESMEDVGSGSVLMDTVVDWRCTTDTARRGTEIKIRKLELLEAAASLTCCKLSVTVQCGRCKMRSDIVAHPHRGHRIVCERCTHKQRLNFRPQMMHPFSSVLGYLDLESCQVVDIPVLTCEFALQCLPCGRQNFVSGVQYGQCHNTWCLYCHSKMSVQVESIKLNQLQPNTEIVEAKAGQPLKLEKKEKRVKDPAVQEGKPLPENGACKHYKKSFRWLRFPCCGKAYPCDHCHDEKETDHDMKFGTRMICGFCAKEQPYSKDRPCTACFSNMTKKTGTHWEGGKGCRDKVKMSKDDKQKYSGTNKTVSKKALPPPKKEK